MSLEKMRSALGLRIGIGSVQVGLNGPNYPVMNKNKLLHEPKSNIRSP